MTQMPPQGPAGAVPNPGKGLSIAGMVLGIVCLAIMCIPYINFLSIPCAIVGLILSIMGKKKSKAAGQPTGMATAGIILSIIALALAIIIVLIVGLLFGLIFAAASQIQMNIPTTIPVTESLRWFQLLF
jgi:hypothetical protein